MQPSILEVVISAGLLWAWLSGGPPCGAHSCAPLAPSTLAGAVSRVTSRSLVTPRSHVVGQRDCVGLPNRARDSTGDLGPLMVVTSELLT